MHPYKDILSNLPGNATIVRGGHVKEKRNLEDILQNTSTQNTIDPAFEQGFFQTPNSTVQKTIDSQQSLGELLILTHVLNLLVCSKLYHACYDDTLYFISKHKYI